MARELDASTLSIANLLILDTNSFGTGFQMIVNNYVFLITAKHVLYDSSGDLIYKTLEISQPSADAYNIHERKKLEIKLGECSLIADSQADVCCILLGKIDDVDSFNNNSDVGVVQYYKAITVNENPKADFHISFPDENQTFDDLLIGNDAFSFGYPISLGLPREDLFDKSAPLIRKGIISGLNLKNHTFIVDCPTYYGNSGSPVIAKFLDGKIKLAGLVSRFIPLEVTWYNRRDKIENHEYTNSGFTVCIPIDTIIVCAKRCLSNLGLS